MSSGYGPLAHSPFFPESVEYLILFLRSGIAYFGNKISFPAFFWNFLTCSFPPFLSGSGQAQSNVNTPLVSNSLIIAIPVTFFLSLNSTFFPLASPQDMNPDSLCCISFSCTNPAVLLVCILRNIWIVSAIPWAPVLWVFEIFFLWSAIPSFLNCSASDSRLLPLIFPPPNIVPHTLFFSHLLVSAYPPPSVHILVLLITTDSSPVKFWFDWLLLHRVMCLCVEGLQR